MHDKNEMNGVWDGRDDTALQARDSKFEPWWSEAELATSRSHRLTCFTAARVLSVYVAMADNTLYL